MEKRGKVDSLLIGLNILGFTLLFVGAALIRYSKDEVMSIVGGFVLAGGVTALALTRLISK